MTADQPEQRPSISADRSSEPDRPQIGIVHLLVWTACVAVYLGLFRTVSQVSLIDRSGPFLLEYGVAVQTLNGIGCGNPFEKTAHTFTGDPAVQRATGSC